MTTSTAIAVPSAAVRAAPLPLVTFERYLFADDRPEYPMTPLAEFIVRGRFDRPLFEAALLTALRRNVLLHSLVATVKGQLHWIPSPELLPAIDWKGHDIPIAPAAVPIDLRRETGMRTFVREDDGRTRVVFQFHHACIDGYGMAALLDDLMTAYAAAVDPQTMPASFRSISEARLRQRGDFAAPAAASRRRWGDLWRRTRDVVDFMKTAPATLAAHPRLSRTDSPQSDRLHMHTHVFDLEASQRLRDVSLNDFALARLMQAIGRWNGQQGGDPRKPLRIVVPTDLRDRADLTLPAANRSGFAFVTRKLCDLNDEAALLEGIRSEMLAVRHQRLGLGFLQGVSTLMAVRGALPIVLGLNACAATAVLSYLGDPTRRILRHLPRDDQGRIVVGETTVEHMFFTPPLRPLTRLAVGIVRYAGRVHLGMKCDPWLYTPEESRSLLSAIVDAFGQPLLSTGTEG